MPSQSGMSPSLFQVLGRVKLIGLSLSFLHYMGLEVLLKISRSRYVWDMLMPVHQRFCLVFFTASTAKEKTRNPSIMERMLLWNGKLKMV